MKCTQNTRMDFTHYLTRVASDLKAGNATEHTHRPALQTLLESSLPGIKATNEPRRIACGAPDYIVTRGETPIGYIEAKDVGISLDAVQGDEQLKRYWKSRVLAAERTTYWQTPWGRPTGNHSRETCPWKVRRRHLKVVTNCLKVVSRGPKVVSGACHLCRQTLRKGCPPRVSG